MEFAAEAGLAWSGGGPPVLCGTVSVTVPRVQADLTLRAGVEDVRLASAVDIARCLRARVEWCARVRGPSTGDRSTR